MQLGGPCGGGRRQVAHCRRRLQRLCCPPGASHERHASFGLRGSWGRERVAQHGGAPHGQPHHLFNALPGSLQAISQYHKHLTTNFKPPATPAPCTPPLPAHPAPMHRLLHILLLAALALVVAASPSNSRKLLHANPCKQLAINGCVKAWGSDYVCQRTASGKVQAIKCLTGNICDVATLTCVDEEPEEPAGPCADRADGCYHFSHHDGMCINGQQSLCPNSGRCNADGTACERPDEGSNAMCEGKRDGCYTGHQGDYACRDGIALDCPTGTRCSSAATDATCV